jgi:organic hydroperoxide reductase OsmC/OhrA
MKRQHTYNITVKWTGNTGNGTSGYRDYNRSHSVISHNKAEILCTSDPAFLGDNTRYNPEELLLASLSSCHMLWYLHLCAEAGVVVSSYTDKATGMMAENIDGSGVFTLVTLHPVITVTERSMIEKAVEIHNKANAMCFIANSVNFPVHHRPVCKVESTGPDH